MTVFGIKINTQHLYDNFVGKTSSNIEIIKCYRLLFKKKYLVNNIGSYVLLFIILVYLICSFTFAIKGYYSLKQKIEYLTKMLKNNNIITKKNLVQIIFKL